MTGFRVHPGGAQALYGVTPDLTSLGKVIGGGLPVGAYGGRRDIMEMVAPAGPVYQAGTLSGNPLAMAAGIATLEVLARSGGLGALGARRGAAGLRPRKPPRAQRASRFSARAWARCSGSSSPTRRSPTRSPRSAPTHDASRRFHRAMLERGVYLAPSQFEAAFLSLGAR